MFNKNSISKHLYTSLLIALSLIILYPLLFILITSIKEHGDIILNPFGLKTFAPQNYVDAWVKGKVGHYFLNSVFITAVSLSMQIIISFLAGYAIGKLKVWGYKILILLYLATLMVTSEMAVIPNFITIRNMGLLNTYWSLIIPNTVGVTGGMVLAVYIFSKFIQGLPGEIDEAAIVEGASTMNIMMRIDIPLIKSVLLTILAFNFNTIWSEFYWALIIVKNEAIKTLPLGLINLQSRFAADYGVLTAGLVILSLPVIILYIIFSKYFVEGATVGAVKG